MKNYYEILEVNEHASREIIEKAYKVLIKKYHPDLYKGEKKQFAEKKARDINEAYRILSDDFLREQYDVELQKEKMEKYAGKIMKYSKKFENDSTREQEEIKNFNNRMKKHKVGSFGGIIELLQEIFRNRPKGIKIQNITKTDLFAVGLTILIVILLGVILWFIPFTNGWMRELTVENPLFSWIGRIFGN